MKKQLLLTIGLIAWTLASSAQSIIQGKIIDKSTGEPILFGTVALMKNGVTVAGAETDLDGNYHLDCKPGTYSLEASYVGYSVQRVESVVAPSGQVITVNISMTQGIMCDEVVITGYKVPLIELDNTTTSSAVTASRRKRLFKRNKNKSKQIRAIPSKNLNLVAATSAGASRYSGRQSSDDLHHVDGIRTAITQHHTDQVQQPLPSREYYRQYEENAPTSPWLQPLSTFSIDVDKTSYTNARRYLEMGQRPPIDAVRIEEMINYFDYDYAGPSDEHPVALHTTTTDCPWSESGRLLHVALQAKKVDKSELPSSNLVFLIDVSGSMSSADKLPLVKSSLKLLLGQLRPNDKVSIVTYAGYSGVALQPTAISDRTKIIDVIDGLGAGGSTAGAQGIMTAYDLAQAHYTEEGNNRVILCTDGDFNVGVSHDRGLEDLITEKRKTGIYLSVLGFGTGNYQDAKMQVLADKGNGNAAYIDDMRAARKVLAQEMLGTLYAVANDVKLQIEFNPATVETYRLVGYETRLLDDQDFNDDTKDAGEIGLEHTVTAIYEITLTTEDDATAIDVDPLKYQPAGSSGSAKELATIKFRYKVPGQKDSRKVEHVVAYSKQTDKHTDNTRLATSAAALGMYLRDSEYLDLVEKKKLQKLLRPLRGDEVSDLRTMIDLAFADAL
jgi:Ca-activated chloride channel family protein